MFFVKEHKRNSLVIVLYSLLFKYLYGYILLYFQVLNILTTFFDVCGHSYHQIMGKCLKSLAELRSSANFTLTNELDYVIGKAIRTMGKSKYYLQIYMLHKYKTDKAFNHKTYK